MRVRFGAMMAPKNGREKDLTATDLARQMKDQGLPTTHQGILMGSCNAGDSPAVTGAQGGSLSTAEKLEAKAVNLRTSSSSLKIQNNAKGKRFRITSCQGAWLAWLQVDTRWWLAR